MGCGRKSMMRMDGWTDVEIGKIGRIVEAKREMMRRVPHHLGFIEERCKWDCKGSVIGVPKSWDKEEFYGGGI